MDGISLYLFKISEYLNIVQVVITLTFIYLTKRKIFDLLKGHGTPKESVILSSFICLFLNMVTFPSFSFMNEAILSLEMPIETKRVLHYLCHTFSMLFYLLLMSYFHILYRIRFSQYSLLCSVLAFVVSVLQVSRYFDRMVFETNQLGFIYKVGIVAVGIMIVFCGFIYVGFLAYLRIKPLVLRSL